MPSQKTKGEVNLGHAHTKGAHSPSGKSVSGANSRRSYKTVDLVVGSAMVADTTGFMVMTMWLWTGLSKLPPPPPSPPSPVISNKLSTLPAPMIPLRLAIIISAPAIPTIASMPITTAVPPFASSCGCTTEKQGKFSFCIQLI